MGSGKTHWGRLLAAKMQLPFLDLDTVITELEGQSVAEIFKKKGEEYFRYKEKEVLEGLVGGQERFILSCGGGTPCFFNNIEFMKRHGKVVWLNTSIDVLNERLLKERMSRPLIREIESGELKLYIIRKLGERRMYYEQADIMINEEHITLEELIPMLLRTPSEEEINESRDREE